MDINGAVALVTGGASGIGAASARALAAKGALLVLVDRDDDKGPKAAAELGGTFVHADVTSEPDVQHAVDLAVALGPLRVLVNAAGMGIPGRTVDRHQNPLAQASFDRVIAVNLQGTFNCLRLAAAAMATLGPVDPDGQRGAIVNLASVAAFDGQIGQAAYAASKGGIVGMTLPIAHDLAAIGVRVNTVAPGLIDTPIYGEGPQAEAMKSGLAKSVVFPPRLGTADELASVVVELVTNDYMNGETVRVDGAIRLPPK